MTKIPKCLRCPDHPELKKGEVVILLDYNNHKETHQKWFCETCGDKYSFPIVPEPKKKKLFYITLGVYNRQIIKQYVIAFDIENAIRIAKENYPKNLLLNNEPLTIFEAMFMAEEDTMIDNSILIVKD